MKQQRILWLLIVTFVIPQAGLSQGMVEQGGIYSGVAGLGAGLAAGGRTHADTLKHSFEAVGRAQQAIQQSVQEQTAIIEHNMKLGCQFEATKQWESAENAFKWVLQGVAHRDGPGSPAAVPALRHLVNVSEAQNKLDDAIGFQKTVVAFGKVGKSLDATTLAKDQIRLCELYCQKNDYATAEPILRQMVETPNPSLSSEQQCAALTNYYQVLQGLHKTPYIDPRLTAREQPKPIVEPKPTATEETIPAVEPKLTVREETKPVDEPKAIAAEEPKSVDELKAIMAGETKSVDEPKATATEETKPVDVLKLTATKPTTQVEQPKLPDAQAVELAKAEATQLLDYVMNTILRQRTALLGSPLNAVLQGQDVVPENNTTQPGEGKPATTEP